MLGEVAVVAALLVAAFLFARIAATAGLPPVVSVVLVGIAAAGMLPHRLEIALTPGTLALFLPALIFEGAWEIDIHALRRMAGTILMLALPGVLLTAAVVASGTIFAAGLPLVAALALGAIVSATDPVAVLALFRTLALPLDLRTIVEGESIANDGVAVVLTQTVIAFAYGIMPAPLASAFVAIYVICAGIAIGVVFGMLAMPLLRRFPWPPAGIATTLAIAYGAYALASLAHASGIFASAAAGVTLRAYSFEKSERNAIARFWDGAALVANAVVFLLIGLSLDFVRMFHEPALLIGTLAAVVLARLLLAYVVAPLAGGAVQPASWHHAIGLAGVRGGLSLALALGLPPTFPERARVIDAVFAVVFVTIVLAGPLLAPLLRRVDLRLHPNG